jgi:hypothetical protein
MNEIGTFFFWFYRNSMHFQFGFARCKLFQYSIPQTPLRRRLKCKIPMNIAHICLGRTNITASFLERRENSWDWCGQMQLMRLDR